MHNDPKKVQNTLLKKEWLEYKLQKLRAKYFLKPHDTGLTGFQNVETGKAFPSWPTLVEIIYQCGLTLTDFFADIETQAPATSSKTKVLVSRRHRELHEHLEQLLNHPDDAVVTTMTITVSVFWNDFCRGKKKR